ncbi:hypothetical protein BGZ91_010311, partial [Linnemannia elongata]
HKIRHSILSRIQGVNNMPKFVLQVRSQYLAQGHRNGSILLRAVFIVLVVLVLLAIIIL